MYDSFCFKEQLLITHECVIQYRDFAHFVRRYRKPSQNTTGYETVRASKKTLKQAKNKDTDIQAFYGHFPAN